MERALAVEDLQGVHQEEVQGVHHEEVHIVINEPSPRMITGHNQFSAEQLMKVISEPSFVIVF